ncbi:hypothetical protein [Sessilibacter sp. MAH2]
MDLHDFSGGEMYFDEQLSERVSTLIEMASEAYAEGNAEISLLKAYFLAPKSLSVLVAVYRFYYYQHRYDDALDCADKAMTIVAEKLNMNIPWRKLDMTTLGYGLMTSMTLVRFYLLALKGAGYLNLRLNRIEEGVQMLEKVRELDTEDRLGTGYLLETVESYQRRKAANFGKLTVVA